MRAAGAWSSTSASPESSKTPTPYLHSLPGVESSKVTSTPRKESSNQICRFYLVHGNTKRNFLVHDVIYLVNGNFVFVRKVCMHYVWYCRGRDKLRLVCQATTR